MTVSPASRPLTLDAQRRAAADLCYEAHSFAPYRVAAAGGWETDIDAWKRTCFLEDPEVPEADSVRETFVVTFRAGTASVLEAYVSGW